MFFFLFKHDIISTSLPLEEKGTGMGLEREIQGTGAGEKCQWEEKIGEKGRDLTQS